MAHVQQTSKLLTLPNEIKQRIFEELLREDGLVDLRSIQSSQQIRCGLRVACRQLYADLPSTRTTQLSLNKWYCEYLPDLRKAVQILLSSRAVKIQSLVIQGICTRATTWAKAINRRRLEALRRMPGLVELTLKVGDINKHRLEQPGVVGVYADRPDDERRWFYDRISELIVEALPAMPRGMTLSIWAWSSRTMQRGGWLGVHLTRSMPWANNCHWVVQTYRCNGAAGYEWLSTEEFSGTDRIAEDFDKFKWPVRDVRCRRMWLRASRHHFTEEVNGRVDALSDDELARLPEEVRPDVR